MVVDVAQARLVRLRRGSSAVPVVVADPLADHERVGVEQQRAPAVEPDRRPQHLDRLAPQRCRRPARRVGQPLELAPGSACVRARVAMRARLDERAAGSQSPAFWDLRQDPRVLGLAARHGRASLLGSRAPTRDTTTRRPTDDQRPRASRRPPVRPRPARTESDLVHQHRDDDQGHRRHDRRRAVPDRGAGPDRASRRRCTSTTTSTRPSTCSRASSRSSAAASATARGPGAFAFLPRGIAHTFRVVGDRPARFLTIAAPGGLEGFFRDAGRPAAGPGLPSGGPSTSGCSSR